MSMATKSIALNLVLQNTWSWALQRKVGSMVVPLSPQRVGEVKNFALVWGCFAVTCSTNQVRDVQAGLVVPVPAGGGLVDARGQFLSGGR